MKVYTLSELISLAMQDDSVEVLRFVNKLVEKAAKEEADELKAMEEEALDRGSMMDQYPEQFMTQAEQQEEWL